MRPVGDLDDRYQFTVYIYIYIYCFATSFGTTYGVAYASCMWMPLRHVSTDVFLGCTSRS